MSRTKIATIGTAVAVLLSLAGCGTATRQGTGSAASPHPFEKQSAAAVADTDAVKDVKITSTKTVNDPYSGPELDTKYTVTNPTGGRVSYTITFEYLSKDGTRLSEDYGDVESLSGHQASHETLTLWGDDFKGVTSVHVIDVVRASVV